MSHSLPSDPSSTVEADSRSALILVGVVSAVATAFLFWLIYFKSKASVHASWVDELPWLNAILNGSAALCLIRGFIAIKKRQISTHRQSMLAAFSFSTLFLLSYVTYHSLHAESHFPGAGVVKYLYFFILISHVSLSMISLPLVLAALLLALKGRFQLHRKIARWTFPIWLYVSITGVLVVLFLKAYGA